VKIYKINEKYLSKYLDLLNQIYIPNDKELVFKEILVFNELNDNINIVTSHQPNLLYPGTFIKLIHLFKSNLNKKLFIFNDSDKFNINLLNKTIELDLPYETISTDYLKNFIYILINQLKEININFKNFFSKTDFSNNIFYFIDLLSSIDLRKSEIFKFSDFIYFIINKYFEFFNKKINDIDFKLVSDISKTNEFQKIFYDYLKNYKDLNNLYNEAVEILYLNNIKTVRKIEIDELPFWIINSQGFRKTLHVDNYNRVFYIKDNEKKYLDIKEESVLNLIRSKAVLWAIFRRIYFSNIDVLGIGSVYYTFISDYLIFNYYLNYIRKPKILKSEIITITLYPFNYNEITNLGYLLDNFLSILNGFISALNYNIENLSKIFEKLKNYLELFPNFLSQEFNDIYNKIYNAIQLINNKIDKELINHKQSLIKEISNPNNRKIKKELTKELEKINQLIKEKLNPDISYLKDLILELNNKVLFYKDIINQISTRYWPFFIFNLDDYLNHLK
jgi:hypothetical protein